MRVDGDTLPLPFALYEGRKRPYNVRGGLRRAQNDLAGGECGATARAHGWRGSAKTPKSPKKSLYRMLDAVHGGLIGVGAEPMGPHPRASAEGLIGEPRSRRVLYSNTGYKYQNGKSEGRIGA